MQTLDIITSKDLELLRESILMEIRKLLRPQKPNNQHWLKSKEVRSLLKISAGSLQNLRISGKLHPKKIGGTYYYNAEEVRSLFE